MVVDESASIEQAEPAVEPPAADLLALDDALHELEQEDKLKAEVVKMRFFTGLTIPETAAALGISSSTADNYWAYAKAWLRVRLAERHE